MRKIVQKAWVAMMIVSSLAACAVLEPTPTPTPLPTPTPPPTLTEAEQLRRQMALEFVDINWYVSASDSLWFVGTVRNTGSVPADSIRIDMTLKDVDGNIVAESFTYADYLPLPPGETTPFSLVFSDQNPAWATYEVVADARPYRLDLNYTDLALDVSSAEQNSLFYSVIGEVTNTGSQPVRFVQVTGTFFDEAGRVVAADFTFADVEVLEPGQTVPFELLVFGQAGEIADFVLVANASRYEEE